MLTYSSADLEKLSVHFVGKENQLTLSPSPVRLQNQLMKEVITSFFLSGFKEAALFEFAHESDLKFNEVYSYCSQLFKQEETFHENTIAIAQHLAAVSTHPEIKGGELYVAKISQL